MKVYIIRHGKTEMNKLHFVNGQIDEPLAEEGRKQAKEARATIPQTVQVIFTSNLKRARETAEIISNGRNIKITPTNNLSEIHMGNLAGKSWEQMENGKELKSKHRTAVFDYRPYGGESINDVVKRLKDFFRSIDGKYKDGEVLIVTHGGIIRVLGVLENGNSIYETEQHINLRLIDITKLLSSTTP